MKVAAWIRVVATALVATLAAAGCSGGERLAVRRTTTTAAPAAPAAPPCPEPPEASTASFAPDGISAEAARAQTIHQDRLVAGVAADNNLLGYRDPRTAALAGFDIDVAREVAQRLFGDRDRIEFRVVTNAQRIKALEDREVDVVVRSMTITCDRWQQIDFSTEYLRAGQRLLVKVSDADAGIDTLDELAGRPVCVSTGSTGLRNLRDNHPDIDRVEVPNNADCMIAFQDGVADAMLSDDTILAGFAGQDPYARVVGERLTEEPYGIGVRKGSTELTRFVNRALDDIRATTWQEIYDRWLAGQLGDAPIPSPAYGRQP